MKLNINPTVKFKAMIIKRFSVRIHMFMILTAVITFGLVLSRVLLMFGLTSLIIRSTVVIITSYGFFFIAIRVWLFYVLPSFQKKESLSSSASSSTSSSIDGDGILPIDIPIGEAAGGGVPSGGGLFSGAGNSGNWSGNAVAAVAVNDASTQAAVVESAGASSSGVSDSFSIGDLDVDSAGALVIVLIAAVIMAMLGGAVYIIYQAPIILSEAAFNALLSGGMVRASKKMRGEDWTGSVFKATWIPFVIIAIFTIGAAAILTFTFPGETNISDIVRHTLMK